MFSLPPSLLSFFPYSVCPSFHHLFLHLLFPSSSFCISLLISPYSYFLSRPFLIPFQKQFLLMYKASHFVWSTDFLIFIECISQYPNIQGLGVKIYIEVLTHKDIFISITTDSTSEISHLLKSNAFSDRIPHLYNLECKCQQKIGWLYYFIQLSE